MEVGPLKLVAWVVELEGGVDDDEWDILGSAPQLYDGEGKPVLLLQLDRS